MSLTVENLDGKRILGMDYGEKVIGTALFAYGRDPFPMPFEKIINLGFDQVVNDIKRIIEDEFIDMIVIGVPYLLDGKETANTKKIKGFIQKFQKSLPETICYEQDETLSTFEAQERMKSSPRYNFAVDIKQIDTLSAAIILEDFLKRISDENH